MSDRKRLKGSTGKYIPRATGSASDPDYANDSPGGFARGASGQQSSGEQNSQQTELSPLTRSRRSRLLGKFKRGPPSSPPTAGVKRPNNTTGQPIATAVSPLLAVPVSEPTGLHSSHVGLQISPLTVGGTVTAMCSGDHDSLSSSDTHGALRPQMQLTSGPDVIEPSLHSSVVWAKAIEIAGKKLGERGLPPLDLTNLPSAEENIQAVVEGLNTLWEDNKKKQWSYTWRGRRFITVEQWGEILKSMEKYTKAVDTATQALLKVGALVWASVLAIMQVRIYCTLFGANDTNSMSRLL